MILAVFETKNKIYVVVHAVCVSHTQTRPVFVVVYAEERQRMTAFVLPHHANSDTLRNMLHQFRGRLQEETSASSTPHLPNMFNALQKRSGNNQISHHYMIYWPLTREAFDTKRCLYETSVSSIVPAPQPFHFVYITSLLTKIHPKKNCFRSCKCTDHAKRIRLDWREFVYPQFVELLFKRSLTPTSCPSPLAENTIQLINKQLQCRFEIDTRAAFLNDVCLFFSPLHA